MGVWDSHMLMHVVWVHLPHGSSAMGGVVVTSGAWMWGVDQLLLHMVRVYMPHGSTDMGMAATCSACVCGKVPGRYTWYGCIWHMVLQT